MTGEVACYFDCVCDKYIFSVLICPLDQKNGLLLLTAIKHLNEFCVQILNELLWLSDIN